MTEELTQDLLKELFDYRDGNLYWKVRKAHRTKIGDIAGTDRKRSYQQVGIDGKVYFTHRLIFLWHHRYLPEFLDHIDGDPTNNDISNLREATRSQNQWNRQKPEYYGDKPTTSKFKGVTWYNQSKKWLAQIQINGKHKHIGYFTSEIEAAKAYDKAAIELFGEFVNTNKSMDC